MPIAIKQDIYNFVQDVYQKYKFNLDRLSKTSYTINKPKQDKFNCKLCHAKIILNGQARQCSRKKKYGKLCGLHSKKKDQPMYTQNDDSTIAISPFKELQTINSNKNDKLINSYINNLFYNTKEYNEETNWSIVLIGDKSYRYNTATNQVLTENGVENYQKICNNQ